MHLQPGYALERGCELHLKHWLKRHASLQAKVLPLKPAAFTCRLHVLQSCPKLHGNSSHSASTQIHWPGPRHVTNFVPLLKTEPCVLG